MKVKSEREVAQSYLTLSDPMDCSLPGSFIHRIFQARVLELGVIAFSDNFFPTWLQIQGSQDLLLLGLNYLPEQPTELKEILMLTSLL